MPPGSRGGSATARGRRGEERARQRKAAAGRGGGEGQQLQPPRAPTEERWGIPGQIHPWGRTPSGGERLQEEHSEKRAGPPVSTAVLDQVKAPGSPVACLQPL